MALAHASAAAFVLVSASRAQPRGKFAEGAARVSEPNLLANGILTKFDS